MKRKIFLLLFLAAWFLCPAQRNQLLFECTFEESNPLSKFDSLSECRTSIQVVDSVKRFGNKSVRFFLNYTDTFYCNNIRSQAIKSTTSDQSYASWYGFSVMFANDYPNTYDGVESFFQFYRQGTDTMPPFTLNYEGFYTGKGIKPSGKYITLHQNLISPDSTVKQSPYTTYIYPLDTVSFNRWIDVVINVKWSPDSSGYVKVWVNNKLMFINSGPNNYTANSMRAGVDKMDWRSKWELASSGTRTLYFDEIRIGSEAATYLDVLPDGSGIALPIRQDAPVSPTRRQPTPFYLVNPVRSDIIQLSIPSDRKKTVTYELFDINGRSIRRGVFSLLRGSNYKEVSVANVAKGMYFFAVQSESGLTVKKLIK